MILRGGSEAIHSNLALAGLLHEALRSAGLPEDAAQVVETTDRAAVAALCKLDKYVDVMIPGAGIAGARRVRSRHHARAQALHGRVPPLYR